MFTKKNPAPAAAGKSLDKVPPIGLLDKAMERPAPLSTPPAPAPQVSAAPQTQAKESFMNKPITPNPAPSFRPDLARPDAPRADQARSDMSRFDVPRKPEMGGVAGRPAEQQSTADMRRLIVGPDIMLSGEISACDYLVVEGTVEARVREGRRIEIAEKGLFRGTVEIDEADIAGRFEGDITVRGRLRVRSTGRIDGKIQYGEIEVEAGGHLEGEVHGLKRVTADKPVPATAPVAKARPVNEAPASAEAAAAPAQQQPVAAKA